jgi:tight adherence protein C
MSMERFWYGALIVLVTVLLSLWVSHWIAVFVAVCVVSVFFISWLIRYRSAERLREALDSEESVLDVGRARSESWLRRWLFLAGFRRRYAPAVFVALTVGSLLLGIGGAFLMERSGVVDMMVNPLRGIPGGIGEAFIAVAYAGPWIVLSLLASVPWLVVRAARRQRVMDVDQDLPLMLELLATLTEGGLSFDAALDKILSAQARRRPLAQEFRTYHRELQLGISRLQALRRLAYRLEVTAVSFLVSALIQSEQIGSGIAGTLRRQADDLRNRRREQALMLAQALPVKLVFPLILCFLPGIFVSTLAPALYQLVNLVSGITGGLR